MMKTGILGMLSAVLLASFGTKAAASEAELSAVRYDVTFDSATAARREIHVEMSFGVDGREVVALSLPAWTPGSYELDDYAQNVRNVRATQDGGDIDWDKADFDTWRVYPTGAGRVSLSFDYYADALDVGSAWAAADFAFFNGTNLFLFPEGEALDFDAEVVFHTEPGWGIVTGMAPAANGAGSAGSASGAAGAGAGRSAGSGSSSAASSRTYSAADYHELVDKPTFVGRFDLDSAQVNGTWYRLASYPAGRLAGQGRTQLWDQIRAMMPPMVDVFDVVPWQRYTTMLVFDPSFGGGAALEHSNSHFGIYQPAFIGSPILASITAHEIFHAWNVKRMRPADLWPYEYGHPMPTELLWVSEGITDYYADLALVRGGVIPRGLFYQFTQAKIDEVAAAPRVALEDASLSTWIQPRDGTASLYYPKGSLAGLLLDILIRDASDNANSLDDVMKTIYEEAYGQGEGFTEDEWWAAVREAAGGRAFDEFEDAYVDGREPYPWARVLPLAGMELHTETTSVPRIGVTTTAGQGGVEVVDVVAGSAGGDAGVRVGDIMVRVAGIPVESATFGEQFRQRFQGGEAGTPYEIVVRRGGTERTLSAELRFADVTSTELREDPQATPKAIRIREGILTGATGGG